MGLSLRALAALTEDLTLCPGTRSVVYNLLNLQFQGICHPLLISRSTGYNRVHTNRHEANSLVFHQVPFTGMRRGGCLKQKASSSVWHCVEEGLQTDEWLSTLGDDLIFLVLLPISAFTQMYQDIILALKNASTDDTVITVFTGKTTPTLTQFLFQGISYQVET